MFGAKPRKRVSRRRNTRWKLAKPVWQVSSHCSDWAQNWKIVVVSGSFLMAWCRNSERKRQMAVLCELNGMDVKGNRFCTAFGFWSCADGFSFHSTSSSARGWRRARGMAVLLDLDVRIQKATHPACEVSISAMMASSLYFRVRRTRACDFILLGFVE